MNALTNLTVQLSKKAGPISTPGWNFYPTDLNAGAGGDFIYVGYQQGTQHPITAVKFEAYDKAQSNSIPGWNWSSNDLNTGAKGKFIYMYWQNGTGTPITNLMFLATNQSTPPTIPGYVQVGPDLNLGAGGQFIWAYYSTTAQPDWMTKLADDKLLSELSIPGTHDTCALYDWTAGSISTTYNAKCQSWDLESQLANGVRVLDLRLKKISANTLQAWHGDNPTFSVDQQISFDRIVEICQTFLSEFNGETVIMSIKKEDGNDISSLVEQKINSNSQLWYTSNNIPLLKDVRGKIVLLRRFDGSTLGIDLSPGKWSDNNPNFDIPVPNGTFRIQDEYHPSGDKDAAKAEKWNVVKTMLNLCNTSNVPNCWYLNFTSGYYMVSYGVTEIPDIAVISNAVNPQLVSYLPQLNKCGTLMVDFINQQIIQEIICLNK